MKSQPHVLVVDDEPLVLNTLQNLLEFDYTVHTAEDGFTGLKILQKEPVAVILSDQRMPEMLGHEFLRQAKLIRPNAIRILLTGYSDLEAVMNSVNAGEIFRYLNKPWKSDLLLSVVKLGVQVHDELSGIIRQAAWDQRLKGDHSTHIEVEEKTPNVLFVGYENGEVAHLVKQLEDTFAVSAATSIDEAFREIARKPISVIVSEVKFEEFDGVEFLSAVRQDYPHIVTVILTEVVDAQLAIRSINELQVFKYLTKPLAKGEFKKVLTDAALRNQQYAAAPAANLQLTAQKLTPAAAVDQNDTALRLRLRAAQAMVSKKSSPAP